MKRYLFISFLLISSTAWAEEDVDRNAQMKLLQQNFMQRQGIQGNTPHNTTEQEKIRQGNKEYRDAVLKAMNERKVQQGVK